MQSIREQLKGRLIVSCQASPGDSLDDTETIRRIAHAALAGGAGGLRLNSPEHIAAIRRDTDLPIIGIQKRYFEKQLSITPDFASAAALAEAGATIVALDCTGRARPSSDPWQQILDRIHRDLNLAVMADIATFEEARAAAEAGADFIGPTLNGYTEETRGNDSFSWSLLADLVEQLHVPIVAEGHISTPEEAARALQNGAWCVVAGTAITRPGTITEKFVHAMRRSSVSTHAIGVDIGGTSIKSALIGVDGRIAFPMHVPTEAEKGRNGILNGLTHSIERVLSAAREQGNTPAGIGIASAGVMDHQNGTVFAATDNLPGWTGFNLVEFVNTRFGLPTRIVNDAQAAAMAELRFGVGRYHSEFVALTIGTGIGGGIVSGGRLLCGHRGFAGTIGHHVIRMDGRLCNCGRRGCLEAYVSTAALAREYRKLNGTAFDEPAAGDSALAMKIGLLARAGDPAARKAYAAMARFLAEGVANIFNTLDPELVVLSGGLVEDHEEFAADVQARVTELLHFGERRKPRVQLATTGRYGGVQGAGALVLYP